MKPEHTCTEFEAAEQGPAITVQLVGDYGSTKEAQYSINNEPIKYCPWCGIDLSPITKQ